MVKVFIKGGVWKNSEDEILKAAVMKYGKQQWARVASLLNRKSAKQCKARWFEWLDPSVKKTEWSREEEEKLLHLAKLMPAQWKSIGPLVGRTATQCQEHYEELLDQAASNEGEAAAAGASASQHRLRPGEIDTHPETKPARPDPIDMDEDEIEMLQEARARLANTQGKKAKRKQREKMLGEAKRLADLQKRRELKQAGLLSSRARTRSRKRQREVDYATEIPFHKPAPAGFHDVSIEREKQEEIRKKRLKDIDYKRVNEENYRSRDKEEAAAKKREEQRLKNLERANLQLVINQVSEKSDPVSQRKRGALSLPEPAVNDSELSEVAKLSVGGKNAMLPPPNRSVPTDALLSDYSDRPLPTPMLTPQTVAGSMGTKEALLREASNLKILSESQTPLLGGENKELAAGIQTLDSNSSVVVTPRISITQHGEAPTPMRSGYGQGLAKRDALGLNPNQEFSDTASVSTFGATSFVTSSKSMKEIAREERKALKRARLELAAALSALPAPQFEYDLAVPEAGEDDTYENGMVLEKDAADIESEEQLRLEEEAAALYAARSSVVKRSELPRPAGVIDDETIPVLFESQDHVEKTAVAMLQAETLKLMRHDAYAHPLVLDDVFNNETSSSSRKTKKRKKKVNANVIAPETPLDHIPITILDASYELIKKEMGYITDTDSFLPINIAKSDEGCSQMAFEEGWFDSAANNDPNHTGAMKAQLQAIKDASRVVRKRADKLSANLAIKHGGYTKRADNLLEEMTSAFCELNHTRIEEFVYDTLLSSETNSLPTRISKLEMDVNVLEDSEVSLQQKYGELLLEKNRFTALIKKQAHA